MTPTTTTIGSPALRNSRTDGNECGPYDILCGRCKQAFRNVGNRRFRVTVSMYLDQYLQTTTKKEKGDLIVSIVRYLRDDVGVRFLKMTNNNKGGGGGSSRSSKIRYTELGEREAREKVGHALRDLAVSIHHSTMTELKKAKVEQKRRQQQEKQDQHQQRNDATTTTTTTTSLLVASQREPEDSDATPSFTTSTSFPAAVQPQPSSLLLNNQEEEYFHEMMRLYMTSCDDLLEDRDAISYNDCLL
mmetsp:Transcript_96794/g.144952  ORF Transcript_96794/g.144952 Transcript_96794/m.144952 type:complete len:245 (+) Transcript_96794:178-912(+)